MERMQERAIAVSVEMYIKVNGHSEVGTRDFLLRSDALTLVMISLEISRSSYKLLLKTL